MRSTRGLKSGGRGNERGRSSGPSGRRDQRGGGGNGEGWVWGLHAGLAALANPRRTIHHVFATRNAAERLPPGTKHQLRLPGEIDDLLPMGAVHQGLAIQAAPLDSWALDAACSPLDGRPVLVLDQITDPQNVGAIFRSAAAFGARAVILQDRHSPPFTGALAKASAGAIDVVPFVHVVNIARTLEELADMGYHTIGLEGEADIDIGKAIERGTPSALVLGAEGRGLRDLVAKNCAVRARIPISTTMESLNVSAATAIALYEATRA